MNLNVEFKLSLYEELKIIYESKKSKIFLVQNIQNDRIYIKKEIKEYNREIYEAIKNIDSNNITRIYEVLEVDNKLVVIEEFINGETLQHKLERQKKLNEKEIIKYMISLCDILDKIHNLNPPIIHRDIKPGNIIISNDNVLKLIDFDISRTYKEGENLDTTLLGTKGYASPEQFGFDQTDCRSDIYTMGIMMNVLTTGKHIKEEVNNSLLKNIIKKCTHISADRRYENVMQLKRELESILDDRKDINKNKKVIKKSNSKVLPGFRSKKIHHIIIASVWYLFLITGLLVSNSFKEFLENLILIIMMLIIFFIFTNYLNIKSKLPLLRDEKILLNIMGYLLYCGSTFLICGGLLTLLTV